jgi:hypothetical protein
MAERLNAPVLKESVSGATNTGRNDTSGLIPTSACQLLVNRPPLEMAGAYSFPEPPLASKGRLFRRQQNIFPRPYRIHTKTDLTVRLGSLFFSRLTL